MDHQFDVFISASLAAFLIPAVVTDIRRRRIPNALTFPMMATGLVIALLRAGLPGLGGSALGLLVGGLLLLPLFLLGGMGAGDLKLLAGIGSLVGARDVLVMFAVIAIIGAMMGIVLLVVTGQTSRLRDIFLGWTLTFTQRSNHAVLAPSADKAPIKLPYAVPIALGVLSVCAIRLAGIHAL